jgi:hypothetical protein
MLSVAMSDGTCVNGIGCLIGLNTVLTCAKLLIKKDCIVVQIRYIADIV